MPRTRLLFAILLAASACAGPAQDTASKPAVPAQPLIPEDPIERQTTTGTGYALVTAMMVNKDARSLIGMYFPGATLILPDTTVQNAPAIATHLASLAYTRSMSDFRRSSLVMSVLDDSTLADSGSYLMILKRTPRDSVLERGHYTAKWRARAGVGNWVILEDHIIPGPGRKTGAR